MSLYYGRMYMLAAMQCAYMPAAKTDFLNHENGNGSGSTVQYSTGQDRTGQDRTGQYRITSTVQPQLLSALPGIFKTR